MSRTVEANPYLCWLNPTDRQWELLQSRAHELLYGGAAGGGKSAGLLMAALQGVGTAGYSALLLRKSYADLALPGALMDLSHQWLRGRPGASWTATTHTWTFPTGATLSFGYLGEARDHYRYQSAEFQFIGFDELTQFEIEPYLYLFSRLRRKVSVDFPLRMRSASNPGGIGHEWVKGRFIRPAKSPAPDFSDGPIFIPARLDDNPHLDREDYLRSLMQLDPITRAQLLAGDWDSYAAGRFKREWFRTFRRKWSNGQLVYELHTPTGTRDVIGAETPICMMVDPAATAETSSDWTAWCVGALTSTNDVLVLEADRAKLEIHEIPRHLLMVAKRWDVGFVGVEAVAAFRLLAHEMELMPGMPSVRRLSPWGRSPPGQKMKLTRAIPAINRAEAGQVYLLADAPWTEAFVGECVRFTGDPEQDSHDDQVDAFGYLVREMERGWGGVTLVQPGKGETAQERARGLLGDDKHTPLVDGQSFVDLEEGDEGKPRHQDGSAFWWDRGKSRWKERYSKGR